MSVYDWPVIGLRAISLVAVLQATGMVLFIRLFQQYLSEAYDPICRYARLSIRAGIVLTIIQHLLTPIRMTATLSGVWDLSLQTMLLQSDAGIAHGLRLVGLLILAGALRTFAARRIAIAGSVGALCVIVSFLLMGHTASHEGRLVLVVALVIHLLVLTIWFGSLVPFYVVTDCENPRTSVAILQRFSRYAVWAVPMIFVAGVAMASLLLSSLADLMEPYGMLLIVKTTLFAVVMLLAALNKWRFTPGIAAGDHAAQRALKRSVVLEWAGLVIVIGVTTFMTGLFAPAQ